jgi:hypothetical protein
MSFGRLVDISLFSVKTVANAEAIRTPQMDEAKVVHR